MGCYDTTQLGLGTVRLGSRSGLVPSEWPRQTARLSDLWSHQSQNNVRFDAQIAKRAYELYKQRGRQDGPAVQDWEQAEREIRKDETRK